MKIIHCADIHLGSKINSALASIGHERKIEVRNTFMRMCEYASKNDIHIILLSGDVFDSDNPLKKDKDNFCFFWMKDSCRPADSFRSVWDSDGRKYHKYQRFCR